jgi:hypothetical protein
MPGMMKAKKDMPMSYKKGGAVFKPCASCPNPRKCRAAGQCAMKSKKK